MVLILAISGTIATKNLLQKKQKKTSKTKAAMPRKCREKQHMPRKSGNAANTFAAIQKRQQRKHLRQCRAKKHTKKRQCRIVVVRWHSSGTLRYYRANACFCLLFSQALRTLYMSPPCGRQAFASLTSSTRPSSFPRAASPRHPGASRSRARNTQPPHRQIDRVQRDHQCGLPRLAT